jgi:hypothetical protein
MKLKTGEEIKPYHGLLSVDESGSVYEGYDRICDELCAEIDADKYFADATPPISAEGRRDMADQMIARWTAYREAVK